MLAQCDWLERGNATGATTNHIAAWVSAVCDVTEPHLYNKYNKKTFLCVLSLFYSIVTAVLHYGT